MTGERFVEVVDGDPLSSHAASGEHFRDEAQGWTAIILAGQRPGVDVLAQHFGLTVKALVPVAGEPMLTHVVRTLRSVPAVHRIVVLAQSPDALATAIDAGGGADAMISSGGGISASIAAVAGTGDAPWPILVTTADHPLLTRDMIEQFLAGVGAHDVAVAMVERATMLAQFPDAQRTWLRFADGAWSGANLFALTGTAAGGALRLWAEAEQDRKVPWRLFRHFGPWLALRAVTRTIGLARALEKAGQRLGLTATLVPMADPVAAIDVDKPADHALAERIFAGRSPA
ncbi:MAG: nucleotidyltransferase family protein [Sphingopyxis sp.]|nr:nucleotidyltransferase family protein [Sphingopyxis sp.]